MGNKQKYEDVRTDILRLFETSGGDLLDVAYYIYQKIVSIPGREPELLKFVFEELEQRDLDGKSPVEGVFSKEEKDSYIDTYGKVVDGILEALLKKGVDKETFYRDLWKGIQENPILEGEKEKAFAFYFIWIDMRVPYFELEPGIEMGNDEYVDILEEISQEIKRARFILYAPVKQKTEQASRLIRMLDALGNERQKAVFFTQILSSFGQMMICDLMSTLEEKADLAEEGENQ